MLLLNVVKFGLLNPSVDPVFLTKQPRMKPKIPIKCVVVVNLNEYGKNRAKGTDMSIIDMAITRISFLSLFVKNLGSYIEMIDSE